ncbi:MAG TPA: TRAP transporter small permease [Burkholderiales bacterium]|nr:TRAP transporter small permease [Burkholderiales bacterium]
MEKAYAVWCAFQDRVLGRVAGLLLLGCTLLALLEIFRRYIFGVSFEWQQDAVTFFILSGVYLYFGIAQRHGSHLNVALLTESLETIGPRTRKVADVVRLLALVISFVFMLLLIWWGMPEVEDSIKYESRTESLGFPMWPFLLVLLAGFGFMAVTLFFQIYRQTNWLFGRKVLEEPSDAGAAEH